MFEARPKILVVDDARYVRELLKLHLENAGYDALVAEDAVVAGRLVLEDPPALIITDVEMPYMNGIEFVDVLRADQTLPHIPVVFLTSRDDAAQEARHLGAAAYLRKPVNIERLLDIVGLHVLTDLDS